MKEYQHPTRHKKIIHDIKPIPYFQNQIFYTFKKFKKYRGKSAQGGGGMGVLVIAFRG